MKAIEASARLSHPASSSTSSFESDGLLDFSARDTSLEQDNNSLVRSYGSSAISHGTTPGTSLRLSPADLEMCFDLDLDLDGLNYVQPRVVPDDLATSIFFKVFTPGPPGSRGQFDFLPTIYNGAPTRGVLSSAIISIGLNHLANTTQDGQILLHARKKYSATIKEMQVALQDKYRARSDELLTTVILMARFESIINPTLESMFAHLEGAKALVKLRGLGSLRSVTGMRLFGSVRAQVCLSSLIRGTKAPDFIIELSEQSKLFPSYDNVWAGPISMIVLMFCNIRGRLKAGEITDNNEILSSLYGIEEEFKLWSMHTPTRVQYTRIPAVPSTMVFSDHFDLYKDYWSYGIWNHYRSARILCLEHLLRCLAIRAATLEEIDDLLALNDEKQRLRTSLNDLCSDICASMPYFTGILSQGASATDISLGHVPLIPNMSRQQSPATGTSSKPPQPATLAAEGTMVMWPLYTVADCPWADPSYRIFAVEQLRAVSEGSSNKFAGMMAKMLENGPVDREEGPPYDMEGVVQGGEDTAGIDEMGIAYV